MNKIIRQKRKVFQGIVVSDKMVKTRVVTVERTVKDTFYKKILRKKSRFYAHDEGQESHVGDMVEIASARPLSRLKRWRVTRIVSRAQ